ncbi:MAG: type II toxin-antitoxin system RelE/ParE family toxin [Chloracidobacterium sp.]|nr:type II toxin-antitoxin system RelE/ParE family toxin [Chloracidobacterium sp.]
MALTISKRRQAVRDLEECFVFIADDNIEVALSFLIAAERSLDELSRFPFLGKAYEVGEFPNENRRVWHVSGYTHYLLFYEVTASAIDLIRVLHSSGDVDDLLV